MVLVTVLLDLASEFYEINIRKLLTSEREGNGRFGRQCLGLGVWFFDLQGLLAVFCGGERRLQEASQHHFLIFNASNGVLGFWGLLA